MEQFLSSVGIIEPREIIYNPTYEQLFEDELQPGLEGYARGYLTELGAVNVLTGEYTGRSPKDKFIVMDDTTRDSLWWNGNGAKMIISPSPQKYGESSKIWLPSNYLEKNSISSMGFAVQIKTPA